jgi:uncharacterized protein YkwD
MNAPQNNFPRLPLALAATLALAIAGCGGGDSKTDSAAPPPPVNASPSGAGKLVVPEGTKGLVGEANRADKSSDKVIGRQGPISPKANQKTRAQKNGVAAGAACDNSGITPSQDNLAQVSASILCLVNAERQDQGLAPLTQNGQLDNASQVMSDLMVEKVFFAHETPDGRNVVDRVEPTGYLPRTDDWVLGENLAWGSGALSTPQAIVNGWMNSEGHRKNILATDYKDIGIGITMGSPSPQAKGGTTYANAFGAKGQASSDAASAATAAPAQKAKAKKAKKRKRARRRR